MTRLRSMRPQFRPIPARIVLPLLSLFTYSLTLIFLGLRLSSPSDGARLALGAELSAVDAVTVFPLAETSSGLNSGDAVIAVNGRDVRDWTQTLFVYIPESRWRFGDIVVYSVLRDGETLNIPVLLTPLPLWDLLRENAPVAFILVIIQAQAIWMWSQRRELLATQTLLLAVSAFVAFSINWYIGMDLAAVVNFRGLFLFYRLFTFVQLMLMSAGLIHFALVLPQPNPRTSYIRRSMALIYLAPYPLYGVYLLISYTPDALAWLRRWEIGAIGMIFGGFVLTTSAMLSGYQRIKVSKHRTRIRIVMIALALTMLIATLVGVAPALITGHLTRQWQIVPLLSLPVAIGFAIAVVFYRLFDIRIVIQRTLVWVTLTALIVVVYVLVVGALSAVFQTQGSAIFSLIATGIIAVIFAAVRMRLQKALNWLLYGERDTPYQVIARLSKRMEETITPDDALAQIVKTVGTALKLPYAAIELSQDDKYVPVASWGTAGEERIVYPLTESGETIGRLIVAPRSPGEPLTPGDHDLLTSLLYHAQSVIQTARLTADLQHSREKLVMAREEELRRISRDLHDGLGPALASLTLQLDAVRNLLKSDPAQVEPLLLDIKAQTSDALADIRRLVYELHPLALDQRGLSATLHDKARELERASGLRITVETPPSLPTLSAAAEVALYRICLEALTNIVRHANATACSVRLTCNHALHLEVTDNGDGLPEGYRRGVGLHSMIERASELGGTCVIERGADGGTRVVAQLPLIKLGTPEKQL